jgi:hypothetical protein
LFWDDSDEAWAKAREERQLAETVQEPVAVYEVKPAVKDRKSRAATDTRLPAKGKLA